MSCNQGGDKKSVRKKNVIEVMRKGHGQQIYMDKWSSRFKHETIPKIAEYFYRLAANKVNLKEDRVISREDGFQGKEIEIG